MSRSGRFPFGLNLPIPTLQLADLSAFCQLTNPATDSQITDPWNRTSSYLMVLDLTGDLAFVQPAKESLIAELNKLPSNTWVGLLRRKGAYPF